MSMIVQPELGVLSTGDRPWFSASLKRGEIVTAGKARCLLGHRLDSGKYGNDGLWTEWQWDGTRLTARNDRYGMRPLYYACTADGIHVSSSISRVANAVPSTLDHGALAVFFRLGFFLGEDTPFAEVRVLPPGSTLTWERGRLTVERGSIAIPSAPHPVRSFDEAVDRYGELFSQSIARRPPPDEDLTVPISGGRDSRHILLELVSQGHRPSLTVTVRSRPPSPNEDVRIAHLLRDELSLAHAEIDMPHSFAAANLKDLELTDFCSSGHIWLLPVSAYLKGRTGTVYDGLAGSVLSGGFQVNEDKLALYRSGKLEQLARMLLAESGGMNDFLRTSLQPEFAREIDGNTAIERLVTELEKHSDASNPLVSYIFWNRTRRGISLIPCAILDHIERVYCPYLDHDLFDFLINLDVSWTLGNALHDETIRRRYPRYAHIPYENKDAPKVQGRTMSAYYRRAAGGLLAYLAAHPRHFRSRLLRSERVALMAGRDLTRRACAGTWYLRPALYLLELERLRDGRGS